MKQAVEGFFLVPNNKANLFNAVLSILPSSGHVDVFDGDYRLEHGPINIEDDDINEYYYLYFYICFESLEARENKLHALRGLEGIMNKLHKNSYLRTWESRHDEPLKEAPFYYSCNKTSEERP
jgi:hypothetical protein